MKTADFLLFLNVAGKATCFSGVRNSGSVIPWRTLNIFGPPFLLCKVEWDVLWVPLKLYGNCKKLMKLIFNAFFYEGSLKQMMEGEIAEQWRKKSRSGECVGRRESGSSWLTAWFLFLPLLLRTFSMYTRNDLTPRRKSGCGLEKRGWILLVENAKLSLKFISSLNDS